MSSVKHRSRYHLDNFGGSFLSPFVGLQNTK